MKLSESLSFDVYNMHAKAGKWVFRAPECSLKRGVNEVENKVANKVNIIKIKTGIRKGQSQYKLNSTKKIKIDITKRQSQFYSDCV